ncbi:MAG: ribosomal-processing cysteine protease Prp [Defluviitaleaceae bacterium]|nr:ribosomal-processing cysteine protease Prp [Defluviitaleaceae bacterium]
MIKVSVTRGRQGDVRKLKVSNHGHPIVCAAVSMLVTNAINSIEKFTDEEFSYNYNKKGEFLEVVFHCEPMGDDARLLTDSLMLGLHMISKEYPDNIMIRRRQQYVKTKPTTIRQ